MTSIPADLAKGTRPILIHWPKIINRNDQTTLPPRNVILSDRVVYYILRAGVQVRVRAERWNEDFDQSGRIMKTRPN